MLTKTKIALAALIVAGTASAAMAQGEFDGNLGNRYPVYTGPAAVAPQGTFQSAPVRLNSGSNAGWTQNWSGRPEVRTFHYDSAPAISGAGN
jgi:hypothetical protein